MTFFKLSDFTFSDFIRAASDIKSDSMLMDFNTFDNFVFNSQVLYSRCIISYLLNRAQNLSPFN